MDVVTTSDPATAALSAQMARKECEPDGLGPSIHDHL